MSSIHVDGVRLPVVFSYLVVDHGDDVGADRGLINRRESARATTRFLHGIVFVHRYDGTSGRQRHFASK